MSPKRDARLPSWSIVIETANLQTADQSDLITSLDSIASQDPSPAEANEVVILDSGEAEPELLKDLLARYPWARVEQIPEGTDYGDQKSLSAEFTTGEVVVFADSDCTYDKGCLASYLETFAQRSDVEIQAGETAILIRGPFTLAMALVYFFPRFSYEREVSPARGFYGNNVAFRRDVLARCPFPEGLPVYRGQNVIHSRLLREAGIGIWRQPGARSAHSPPVGLVAALRRFYLTGHDSPRLTRLRPAAADAPFQGDFEPYGRPGGRVRKVWERLKTIARQQPLMLLWLPVALPVALACVASFFMGLAAERVRPGAPEARTTE
jgi:hypothetical protein